MSSEYLPVIIIVAVAVLAVAVGAVRYWARVRRERGEADAAIWEVIGRAIDELKQAIQEEAQEITSDELRATAGALYEAYVRSTALSKFISRGRFTALFLETWEKVVGVRRVVALALARQGESG